MGYIHIIGGTMRGRKIVTPSGFHVRPMTGVIRKAIFEILKEVIPGRVVYDVFAGSGIIGFEALSRGARTVYFLEREPKICSLLRQNILSCGCEEKSKVVCLDFLRMKHFPEWMELPEVVFFDPPFAEDCRQVGQKIVDFARVFERALLVIRYPEEQRSFFPFSWFREKDLRRYGRSIIFFGYLKND